MKTSNWLFTVLIVLVAIQTYMAWRKYRASYWKEASNA